MKTLPQFTLGQLFVALTAICILLAAGMGAFGKLVQVIVLSLGLVLALALGSFFLEGIIEFLVYGCVWLVRAIVAPFLWLMKWASKRDTPWRDR